MPSGEDEVAGNVKEDAANPQSWIVICQQRWGEVSEYNDEPSGRYDE
jgi:hypothetical protein